MDSGIAMLSQAGERFVTEENDQKAPTPSVAGGLTFTNGPSDAGTVFSDHCLFASRFVSTVRLSFVETLLEPADSLNPGAKTRYVGHVVMPMEGFRNMVQYLNQVVTGWDSMDSNAE